MADLVVTDARIVLPGGITEGNLVVTGGRISDVGPGPAPRAARTIDARGLALLPGVVDPHTHPGLVAPPEVRLPSESRAMAAGGVTTVLSYFRRPESHLTTLAARRHLTEASSLQDFSFHLVLFDPAQIAEVPRYVDELGISSFKVFVNVRGELGRHMGMDALPGQEEIDVAPVDYDESILELACEQLAKVHERIPVRLNVHCEDSDLVRAGIRAESAAGARGLLAWHRARPAIGEALAIHRVAVLSRAHGVPVYIPHVGSRAAVEAVREALDLGTEMVAETCPHYMLFTADLDREEAKVAPPIRLADDRAAVIDALSSGVLSTLGSDDIPYTRAEKRMADFWRQNSAFGGSGLLLPVAITAGLPLPLVAAVTSQNPARAFGLEPRKGTLLPGADADFVLVDTEGEREVHAADLASSSDFSVYEGMALRGWPALTCSRGTVIFEGGRFGPPGHGRFLDRRPAAARA